MRPAHAAGLGSLSGAALGRAWLEAAKQGGPPDVPALLSTWRQGTLSDAEARWQLLARLPPDPRLAAGAAAFVAAFPYGSTSSKGCWGAVLGLLEQAADARAVPALARARQGGVPVAGNTMRSWLEARLDGLLADLPGRCQAAQRPLDAGARKLAARVERGLRAT